jgi:hypothetical protein
MKLSEEKNVYSLGRFAVWKNSVCADDVFLDIQKIESMIKSTEFGRRYENKLN